MANVGFATLSVIPSFQGFQSRLSAGVAAPMSSAGKAGGKKFGDAAGREAGDRFRSGFGQRLKGFAPLAGLAVGAGAVAFLKDAIDGASDLSESGNKINAIFGEAQGQVQDFASDASAALGQTQLQALDAASTFGTFGKAAGLTGDALAGFSTELVSLSTDMASFYNTDVSTAIEAIGSGLRGEAEPLRQFGVLLDDATLRAEAMSQGLIETTKDALTPQQKVLAAHAVILKQTSDAQGDFERTSDGLANQQRILAAQWEEMKTTVGAELLPAMTTFVSFLSQDALPALADAGGLAKDAVTAFGDLPAPVKAAAGAFAALRIASATGLSATAASGASSLGSAMVDLRLRTMLAADAFRSARTTTVAFNGNIGTVERGVGRLSASMQALKVGASGAGNALRSGLSGAVGVLGGPWGIALAAGTAAVAHFWLEHQRAKQHVEDLTGTLNAQTGAITDNTRADVANALQKEGAFDLARRFGISLKEVTEAASGNTDAYRRVDSALQAVTLAMAENYRETGRGSNQDTERARAVKDLRDAIGGQSDAVAEAVQKNRDLAEAMGKTTDENADAADSFRSMSERIRDARSEIQRLADAENERRLSRVQAKRDELALIETMKEANAEARAGKKTLDESTKAGRANWNALLDVADQWNNSKEKVVNARGAYRNMREEFVRLAEKMGASDEKAKRLADRLLKLPENKKVDITTPGMDRALADLEKLRARVSDAQALSIYVNSKQANDPRLGNNANGTRSWRGGPTWVGERGPEIVNLPRGASVTPNHQIAGGGVTVNVGQIVAQDYRDFTQQTQRRARAAAGGGVNF